MSGLDTRGAMDGFTKGFGLVDGYLARKEQGERADRQLDMREKQQNMAMEEHKEDRQKAQDKEKITEFYSAWANGIEAPITPDMERIFRDHPMADPSHLFNPKTEAAVDYAGKLAQGEGQLFSQQTVDSLNDFYSPRIGRGDGGQKRLAGLYPGKNPGTLAFELEVTGEDGSKRHAPMTKNRGVHDDDEIAQYPVEAAINPVLGAKSIYDAIGDNRTKFTNYLQQVGYLPQSKASWSRVDDPSGAILNRNNATGELKQVSAPRSAPKGGRAADYQSLVDKVGQEQADSVWAKLYPEKQTRPAAAPRMTASDEYLGLVDKHGQEQADKIWEKVKGSKKSGGTTASTPGLKISSKLADLNALQKEYGVEEGLAKFKQLYPEPKPAAASKPAQMGLKMSQVDAQRLRDNNAQIKSISKSLDDDGWMLSESEKAEKQAKLDAATAQRESIYSKYDDNSQQPARQAPQASKRPNPGDVMGGFQYNGGDPSKQSSWSKV